MISTANLIFDSATLALIWAVQLAIYPGLTYYGHAQLKVWHRSYTKRITVVVLPLMFGQLAFSIGSVINEASFLSISKLGLIAMIWFMTFSIFVPLHYRIDGASESDSKSITLQLVKKNWWRTLLWSLVFILSLYNSAIPDLF